MTRPAGRKATLRDVSLLAGVSRMTVTRVFIRPDHVLQETRERVQRAVLELGYVPDRAAGSLATQRSGFVGLVLPTLSNGNFAAMVEGLTEALRMAGYELLIGYTSYSVAEEERQVHTVLSRRPEALVLAASAHSATMRRQVAQACIPVVEVAELPADPIGHVIGFSNYAIGRAAADFLAGLGHKRIAAIGASSDGERRDLRGEARLRGFTDALLAAKLPADMVRMEGDIPFSFTEGARIMARLLDEAAPPDAIFAVSDLAAVGVLMECRRRDIDVPRDMSLLGFGDFEIGRQMVPALSTIAVDFDDLGRRTGELVAELLRHDDTSAIARTDVGFTLIRRGTTRASVPQEGRQE